MPLGWNLTFLAVGLLVVMIIAPSNSSAADNFWVVTILSLAFIGTAVQILENNEIPEDDSQ